jgi:hypothetical protein
MKACWGSGGKVPRILDVGTRWMCVVSFTPDRFTTRESTPVTLWIGGCVGHSFVLDTVVKRKIPNPCRDSNPRSSNP